jgi:hypothetical protein
MESAKSLEIIESMFNESRKSLTRHSFQFLLWGSLLVPAGIAEFLLRETNYFWIVWPIAGVTGGIIATIYAIREGKRVGVQTAGDRMMGFTWGGFGFTLFFAIAYSGVHQLPPHALILLTAGLATFISGGISKFSPFVWGGVTLGLGAMVAGFVVEPVYQSLVFSASLFLGYVIPGLMLRNVENGKA